MSASPASLDAFDLKFLREFMVIAQEGSIRRAGERLGIVPSAISRKLTDAEIRLGVKLFERHSQGMNLTDAGRMLVEHAIHMSEEQDYILDMLGQFRDETRAIIRLGVGEGFAADLMQNGFPALMQNFPNLRFDIRQAGSEELQRLVASGQVDISIAYDPILLPGTRSLAMARQPLCAILPPSSPLAAHDVLDLADVLAQPFAILNSSHAINRLVARAAADRGLSIRPTVETDSIGLLIRYVTAGLGLTFLPRFSATIQEARGDLVIRQINEPLLHTASAHVSVRARRRLPRSVNAVATFLSDRMVAFRT